MSSSSGESSPELPKRASYRSPPAATASRARGKKPLDGSPGYNSSEEYDGSRRPYVDAEVCSFWKFMVGVFSHFILRPMDLAKHISHVLTCVHFKNVCIVLCLW